MKDRDMGIGIANRIILSLSLMGASLVSTGSVLRPVTGGVEPVGPANSGITYGGGSCNVSQDCFTSCLPGGPGATEGYIGTCEGLKPSCYSNGKLIEPAVSPECAVPAADVK